MPYANDGGKPLSMLILLPKGDKLAAVENTLDIQQISVLRKGLVSTRNDVYFPKFKLETKYSLSKTLGAMGMPTAFTDKADFSDMDGSNDLYIGDVIHQAFIDVNEEGTEAAAATAVVIGVGAVQPEQQPPVFRADHPFIFLIQDTETGNILFMGRVINPNG